MGKSPRKNDRGGLGLVVQAYNPSYLGGRDQEDGILKPAQAKKLARPPSQQISQAWWHAPSYGGGSTSLVLDKKCETLSKKK
jgi:hypothetical protein